MLALSPVDRLTSHSNSIASIQHRVNQSWGWLDSSEAQVPAGQVQGHEFEPWSCKKKKKVETVVVIELSKTLIFLTLPNAFCIFFLFFLFFLFFGGTRVQTHDLALAQQALVPQSYLPSPGSKF